MTSNNIEAISAYYLPYLTNSFNHSLHKNSFLDELNKSEVIPLY